MSQNAHMYPVKMAALRRRRTASSPDLRRHLEEIIDTIRRCEAMWALEDRIERSR